MRFKYSVTDPSRNELDSLPHLTLTLLCNNRQIDVVGLVDSGATIYVLPYEIGVHLKETWDERKANIKLAGNMGRFPAMPLAVMAKLAILIRFVLFLRGSKIEKHH